MVQYSLYSCGINVEAELRLTITQYQITAKISM
jgi:hypothetical protein